MCHRPAKPLWIRFAAPIVACVAACLAFSSIAKADGWQPWSGASYSAAPSTSDNRADSQPQVYDVAPAFARAATAEAQYDLAWTNMTATQIRARIQFQHSPEYRRAQQELSDAQAAYDDAAQTVIANLLSDPAYHKLIEKRTQTQIALNSHPDDPADLNAIAQLKMEYSAAASRMEADALAGDSQVRDAKTRLQAAQQVVTGMTERFNDTFANQPAVASAWKTYQNSIVNQAGAQGYLEGALITRADVINVNNLKYAPAPNNVYCGAPYYPYWGYGFSPYFTGYYGFVGRRF
jgi:hypothetical protein